MGDGARKSRWVLCLLAAAVAAAVVFVMWLKRRPGPPPTPEETFPLPPFSESAFLNTGPEARYVGTAACKECHPENHASWSLTAHSRALSDLDVKAEPPGGSFFHKPSGRSYRVYRRGGQLRHEEALRTAESEEVARVDLPVRYLIGSGHFCRSYLVEVEGFLHESPVTWYTSRKQWDMSPGYDFPTHWSFSRPVKVGCLACHAGRAEAEGGNVHRAKIREQAIGCESCHGPGSRHVELRRAGGRPAGDDLTVVHPGRLSRPRLEAVCAVCHQSGVATTYVRGRRVNDFRPGMPLSDYRIDYRFSSGGEKMTVVGHIEQLRRSACYQKSPGLTCLTCHDPHARERPKDLTAFYREKCLDCHTARPCRLAPAERLKKDPADNCAACHMPRGDTDIPHVAFTHHRIGRHPAPPPAPGGLPDLVPIDDVSRLPPLDQARNLGLAYLAVSIEPQYAAYAPAYRRRALDLLEDVHREGLSDGATVEALARLYWEGQDFLRAAAFARQALEAVGPPEHGRALPLFLLADCAVREREFGAAVERLEELTRLRRFVEDWRLLGLCYLEQGQPRKALPALQQALAIRPFRPDVHAALAAAYLRLGDRQRAREHQEKAKWLAEHSQQ